MPACEQTRKTEPTTASRAAPLLTMTGLASVDGTVVLLAANGAFSTVPSAVATGLTVIAGVGAWIAARTSYGGRTRRAHDWVTLGTIAAGTSATTVLAAWLGTVVAQSWSLDILSVAAGLIVMLLAAEMLGITIPYRHTIIGLLLLGGAAGEAAWHWIP